MFAGGAKVGATEGAQLDQGGPLGFEADGTRKKKTVLTHQHWRRCPSTRSHSCTLLLVFLLYQGLSASSTLIPVHHLDQVFFLLDLWFFFFFLGLLFVLDLVLDLGFSVGNGLSEMPFKAVLAHRTATITSAEMGAKGIRRGEFGDVDEAEALVLDLLTTQAPLVVRADQ